MSEKVILVMGLIVGFNIIIIMWKLKKNRYSDAIIDGSILGLVGYTFNGTISGLMVGTIASLIVSIYLVFVPPREYFEIIRKKIF